MTACRQVGHGVVSTLADRSLTLLDQPTDQPTKAAAKNKRRKSDNEEPGQNGVVAFGFWLGATDNIDVRGLVVIHLGRLLHLKNPHRERQQVFARNLPEAEVGTLTG